MLRGPRTARAVFFSRLIREIVHFGASTGVHLLHLIRPLSRLRLLVLLIFTRPRTGTPFHVIQTHHSPPFSVAQPTVAKMSKSCAEYTHAPPSNDGWRSSCSGVSPG